LSNSSVWLFILHSQIRSSSQMIHQTLKFLIIFLECFLELTYNEYSSFSDLIHLMMISHFNSCFLQLICSYNVSDTCDSCALNCLSENLILISLSLIMFFYDFSVRLDQQLSFLSLSMLNDFLNISVCFISFEL
jgi:hypothetical protein